jgi:hypothetical protein
LSLQKPKGSATLLIIMLLFWGCPYAGAQNLIGVRSGYAISGIDFQFNSDPKNVTTPISFSLLYTHYHPMWKLFPYFGIQTGVTYAEQGFSMPNSFSPEELVDVTRYRVVSIPVVSQFHIDFWRFRLLANIGAFGGYRLSAKEWIYTNSEDRVKKDYVYDCYDTRPDFGFIGGGGLAFKMKHFEVQFECNYQYSLSMLYNPRKYSNLYYIYVYPHQLTFSLGLFVPLSK